MNKSACPNGYADLLCTLFLYFLQQQAQIMPCEDKRSHDRNIVQKIQYQRLVNVKENKVNLQEHISREIPLDKSVNPISGDKQTDRARRPLVDGRALFEEPPRHIRYIAPMQA